MSIETTFRQAAEQLKLCQLIFREEAGSARIIEPYAIYLDNNDQMTFLCYERGGESGRDVSSGWRTLNNDQVMQIMIKDEHFKIREGFHPDNIRCKRIFFAVKPFR
jgi:hypothetical protein